MNIYVGQLPYNVKEDELRDIFAEFGEIASLNLIKDRFSGQSKGFAFVEMPNNSEADQAIKALQEMDQFAEVALYGALIHVVGDDVEAHSDEIKRVLREAHVSVRSMASIAPSLEDVFIANVRQNGGSRE